MPRISSGGTAAVLPISLPLSLPAKPSLTIPTRPLALAFLVGMAMLGLAVVVAHIVGSDRTATGNAALIWGDELSVTGLVGGVVSYVFVAGLIAVCGARAGAKPVQTPSDRIGYAFVTAALGTVLVVGAAAVAGQLANIAAVLDASATSVALSFAHAPLMLTGMALPFAAMVTCLGKRDRLKAVLPMTMFVSLVCLALGAVVLKTVTPGELVTLLGV